MSSSSGSPRYHVVHEGQLSGAQFKEFILTVVRSGAAVYEAFARGAPRFADTQANSTDMESVLDAFSPRHMREAMLTPRSLPDPRKLGFPDATVSSNEKAKQVLAVLLLSAFLLAVGFLVWKNYRDERRFGSPSLEAKRAIEEESIRAAEHRKSWQTWLTPVVRELMETTPIPSSRNPQRISGPIAVVEGYEPKDGSFAWEIYPKNSSFLGPQKSQVIVLVREETNGGKLLLTAQLVYWPSRVWGERREFDSSDATSVTIYKQGRTLKATGRDKAQEMLQRWVQTLSEERDSAAKF